jgi:4-diphosphocytidyl-2-C-methyl-D-erythritol kinase
MAPAYAKINLSLEVLGRRCDGFHELLSVMQTVSLHDELSVQLADDVRFQCDEPALDNVDNLVLRAARLLREDHSVRTGAALDLHKGIPSAAGLGGGSSDAAAALVSLNTAWGLHLSHEALSRHAATLGSDVPFFLTGGTALVEGRGERVTPLPDPPESWYVLAKPSCGLSTADVFRVLTPGDHGDGQVTRSLSDDLRAGRAAYPGVNSLQAAACRLSAETRACFEHLATLVDGRALVSGSGPTSIGWVDGPKQAAKAADAMRVLGYWSAAVHSMRRGASTT